MSKLLTVLLAATALAFGSLAGAQMTKEAREARAKIAERFGLPSNASFVDCASTLIERDNLYANKPKDIREAVAFLKAYASRSVVKPLPAGIKRSDLP